MPATTAPRAEPAPRATVFATALVIVAALAALLPAINPDVSTRAVLFMSWLPALLAARLGWGARLGAIRQRFTTERTMAPIEERFRWTIKIRNPEVLTAVGEPTRFRLYLLLELAITGVIWLMFLGQGFAPLLRMVSLAMWGDGTE